MGNKYLNDTGLTHLWGKIKDYISSVVVKNPLFGISASTASSSVKDVVCSDFNSFTNGTVINVCFSYANTYTSSPTLNVNSKGAKAIMVETNASLKWPAGCMKTFVYYNNYWYLTNPSYESGMEVGY